MKRIKKVSSIVLIFCMACMTLVGCGTNNGNGGIVQEAVLPEYTYIAEYEKIETTDYLGQVFFDKTGFYYVQSNYDEKLESSSSDFCHYDLETRMTSTIPIKIEENEYIVQTLVDPENKLVLITQMTDYSKEIPKSQIFICTYDTETDEMTRNEITEELKIEDDYFYMQYALIDSKGNLYLTSGDSNILIFDSAYQLETNISLPTYVNAMGLSKNDELVISYYSDSSGINVLQKYNKELNSFEAEQEISFDLYSQNSMKPGIEQDFLIKTNSGISSYSIVDNTSTEILNWINSDINGDYIQNFTMLEDGRILLFTENWNMEKTNYELVYLTKAKTSDLPEKELISFKTLYLGYDLKEQIIEFNKSNAKYRVVVETYDLTDYEAALMKYQTDLATGNASDIIDLSNSNIVQLANKGLLVDLYSYIDEDPEFAREDFFQNVFDAYTIDEKLCAILPSVNLMTLIGKTKFVGEERGWTPQDIVELTKSLPDDTKMFEYGSKKEIFSSLVSYDLNSYINWETGECQFNSEEFISLMKFANEFPTQEEYETMYESENYDFDMTNSEDQIALDKLILIQGYFSNVTDYQYMMTRFNEPAICVGFPTMEGSGTFLGSSSTVLGMNTNSNKKDGAWEFIRYFLNEDASENMWGLPINKNAYDAMIKKAMEPIYFEEGEEIYVPEDQQRISEDGRIERPVNSYFIENTDRFIYPPSQEFVDEFTQLFESTNSFVSYNNEIINIIIEEADGYFSGQKDAKSVADIIQSRLQIFVNENR